MISSCYCRNITILLKKFTFLGCKLGTIPRGTLCAHLDRPKMQSTLWIENTERVFKKKREEKFDSIRMIGSLLDIPDVHEGCHVSRTLFA